MKKCPVSNHPIDIIPLGRNAVQVTCPASKWYSAPFKSVDEAIEWRAKFDILSVALDAPKRFDPDTQLVCVVGDGWFTRYMTMQELEAWLEEVRKEIEARKPASKSTSGGKGKNAEADKS